MRNRIVDMKQIEIVALGHFVHTGRQGLGVRGVLKQRISRYIDLVIVNAGQTLVKTNGIRVGDEMDIVTADRQL